MNRTAQLIETLLPKDTNAAGKIFGGVIMSIMDKTAAVACWRYAQKRVVTACAERISFLAPINVGDVIYCRATIVHVGRSSMTVELEVDAENMIESTLHKAASGLFTMVALDDDGKPAEVPRWQPETAEELEKWQRAESMKGRG
jgi:uncharacterized protein (TIGR00369 family)